jgi:hypothetical protein
MASIVALDLIKSSLRLVNAIAVGETPSAQEAIDSLRVLNDMLESWSTENLTVFSSTSETFTFSPGVATYSIGPAATFNGVRPIQLENVYTIYQGIDYPVLPIDVDRYNLIPLKTQQNVIPCYVHYDPTFPNGTLTFWPVPQQATTVTITSNTQFTALANTAQSLNYPPGYSRAIRYCLAIDLAAEFGLPVPTSVQAVAVSAKKDIKRANKRSPVATFDPAITADNYTSLPSYIGGWW